eukprot:CAMPEP_0184299952 /NCGR_PEP_ID=MMETSP1049-20130417/10464_1 /TAXON_ID=77928 /ORGANISM="Proteomonas sulcata, Strain CCMP704" /LENGTH=171 /DNA_ID=CAMNT_0026610539 /DNA_START=99 /DNA_END=614 /DNA_ORIENTATION=+
MAASVLKSGGDFGGLNMLTDRILLQIFSHLEGPILAQIAGQPTRFGRLASTEDLWRCLVLKQWSSLETDDCLWQLLDPDWTPPADKSWKRMYPVVAEVPSFPCTLMKSGRAMCSMVFHNFAGFRISEEIISSTLVVERRFPIAQLPNFVSLESASILYFGNTEWLTTRLMN